MHGCCSMRGARQENKTFLKFREQIPAPSKRKNFIYVYVWKRKVTREEKTFYHLVLSSNGLNDWGWSKTGPGARNFIQVSHVRDKQLHHLLLLSQVHYQNQNMKVYKSKWCWQRCWHSKWQLNPMHHSTTSKTFNSWIFCSAQLTCYEPHGLIE